MLRKIWIVPGAFALLSVAFFTTSAVEGLQERAVSDEDWGGVAMATTWTVCSSGCDFTSIQAAVDSASNGDTIELGSETFETGTVLVEINNLTIRGAGRDRTTIVDTPGSPLNPLLVRFDVPGGSFKMTDVTLRSHHPSESTPVRTIRGKLYLENCVIEGAYRGVDLDDDAEIRNCVIRANRGGVLVRDGSRPLESVVIRDSVILGNGDFGISAGDVLLGVVDTLISENQGVGLFIHGRVVDPSGSSPAPFRPGRLTVYNSTVSANLGRGVDARASDVRIGNSTLTGNSEEGLNAGIWSELVCNPRGCINFARGSNVEIDSSTISSNSGDGFSLGRGFGEDGRAGITRSIFAENELSDCNLAGRLEWSHLNIFSDSGCVGISPTDLTDTDAQLLPLADNGGPTPTQALAPDSPAIDAGGEECQQPTDQRGIERPQDGDGDGTALCDIGAYEAEPFVIPISIDIKPDSYPNSVNPYARGVIPVAVLGSDTFDVAGVGVTSLAFGPNGASPAHNLTDSFTYNDHLQDVNLDGYTDLVTHYRTRDTGILCADESAKLTGETLDGQSFEGSDSIQTVGCRVGRWPAIWMKDQDRPDPGRRDGPVNIERK